MAYRLLHTAKRVEKQLLHGLQHGRFNSIQVGVTISICNSQKWRNKMFLLCNSLLYALISCSVTWHFSDRSTVPLHSKRSGNSSAPIHRRDSKNITNPVGRPLAKNPIVKMLKPPKVQNQNRRPIHRHRVGVAAKVNQRHRRTVTGTLVCSDRVVRIRAAVVVADRLAAKEMIKKSGC